MNDERIWEFERSVWISVPDKLVTVINGEALFIVPASPFVMTGAEAIAEIAQSPRWSDVEFGEQRVCRPQESVIVIAYHVDATMRGRRIV